MAGTSLSRLTWRPRGLQFSATFVAKPPLSYRSEDSRHNRVWLGRHLPFHITGGGAMLTSRSGGSPVKYALNAAVLSAFAIAAGSVIADDHRGISQSGEQKNMQPVGHVDLQGRTPTNRNSS